MKQATPTGAGKVIRSYAEAKAVSPDEMVLLEVPGKHARAVYWLVNMLTSPDNSEAGQLVRRLIGSAGPAPK